MDFISPFHTDDLPYFCCQKPDCPDYGKRNNGNLSVCGIYGSHNYRLIRCRTCGYRFSERKGTVFFDCRITPEKVDDVLEHLSEGCGVRQTHRLTGVSVGTIRRLTKMAGKHAQKVHDELVSFSP